MSFRTKIVSILSLSLALAGAAAFAGDKDKTASGAKNGEKAPAWTLTDISGTQHKSEQYAGKIVVLEWVNPECPVCRGAHQDKRIPNMLTELKGMSDVVFLAVNSTHNTDAAKNAEALKKYGVEYPVLLDTDGTVGKAFGARTTPHIFVIDTTGVLRYQGALDNDKTGNLTKEEGEVTNYVLNAVNQIKKGETVSPDSTQPYGCSVKYAKGAKTG